MPDHLRMSHPIHGTCVAVDGKAALIIGASGSGKSTLALRMLAYGAGLISDDRTILSAAGGDVVASAPPNIKGLIEARGMGVLHAHPHPPAPIACVIDLDHTTNTRLPAPQTIGIGDIDVPLFEKSPSGDMAAALMQFLRAGMSDR